MKPHYRHTNLGSSFQQAYVGRVGSQIGRIPKLGALRLVSGLGSVVRWSVDRISRWHQRHAAIHTLQALNDHYLKDIGLDRSQIFPSVEEIIKTGGRTVARNARREHWRW